MNSSVFSCTHQDKKFKLTFDGGILGPYFLELCKSCHVQIEKKFLISEESLN